MVYRATTRATSALTRIFVLVVVFQAFQKFQRLNLLHFASPASQFFMPSVFGPDAELRIA
jgi:hypothetical protein